MWGFLWGALVAAVSSLVSTGVLLLLTKQLWSLRWSLTRDKASSLPLPRGSMGWPLVGETFHWMIQGPRFHTSRRQRHGNVFKTHLLGKPLVRVTGSDNIRKILLGEHSLVTTQWPQSTRTILGPHTLVNSTGSLHRTKRKILAKVFSRAALESYLPGVQEVVRGEVAKWRGGGSVEVYGAARSLTFRVALRVLLGLKHLEEERIVHLEKTFQQLMDNLFSLPLDAPCSGLRKGIKAREILHANMEQIIAEKMSQQNVQDEEHYDAFDYMMSSAKEHGHHLSTQELKETAVELIFAAHSTTASAATSLVLQLLRHPHLAHKARLELEAEGLLRRRQRGGVEEQEEEEEEGSLVVPGLSLDHLGRLRYLDCVVKEVLRFLPPVSGGYRTALKTFELDGCQIPKGWSVMYSIRDTHETAAIFQNPDTFDPERFSSSSPSSPSSVCGAPCGSEADPGGSRAGAGSRFSYVPFGGGVRSCVGKELATLILKTLAVELLAGASSWALASRQYPAMQTVPIVHPVNGLHVSFRSHAHPAGKGAELPDNR